MNRAVISGDVISSTSLTIEDRMLVEAYLKELLNELSSNFGSFGRLIKGDFLELVIPQCQDSLRVMLAIKSFVKSIAIDYNQEQYKKNKRVKAFRSYGIRLAVGFGELNRFDKEKGIIDGEAIYLSGRLINSFSSHNKERIVIKNTLYFISNNEQLNWEFEPIVGLLDTLLTKATSKQSEVLYLKLLNNNEELIAKKLGVSQSVVNQHSTNVGWNNIEKALSFFEQTILRFN